LGRCSGYMAPEYAMSGQFSVKTDVFSFGVLVLEIIKGKKNNWSPEEQSSLFLLSYVSEKYYCLILIFMQINSQSLLFLQFYSLRPK